MSRKFRRILSVVMTFVMCLYAVQARRYTALTSEIKELEKKQEKLIEENKKLVSDIAVLSSADRIERIAVEELGMHKAETEDIVSVQLLKKVDQRFMSEKSVSRIMISHILIEN